LIKNSENDQYFGGMPFYYFVLPDAGPKKQKSVPMVKKGAVAAVTPGAPKPMPRPFGHYGGIETSLPTILTAPATTVAMKPPPDHESPDNPFFPDLQTIKSHLLNMYFTHFARDDKAFFESEKNVQHTLGYMWNFVNVKTLVLEDPSGEIYDGYTVFLRKCTNQLSNSAICAELEIGKHV
jgi:hypothetical protein